MFLIINDLSMNWPHCLSGSTSAASGARWSGAAPACNWSRAASRHHDAETSEAQASGYRWQCCYWLAWPRCCDCVICNWVRFVMSKSSVSMIFTGQFICPIHLGYPMLIHLGGNGFYLDCISYFCLRCVKDFPVFSRDGKFGFWVDWWRWCCWMEALTMILVTMAWKSWLNIRAASRWSACPWLWFRACRGSSRWMVLVAGVCWRPDFRFRRRAWVHAGWYCGSTRWISLAARASDWPELSAKRSPIFRCRSSCRCYVAGFAGSRSSYYYRLLVCASASIRYSFFALRGFRNFSRYATPEGSLWRCRQSLGPSYLWFASYILRELFRVRRWACTF